MTSRKKYLPFVLVLSISAALLIFFLVLFVPLQLLDIGLSVAEWPRAYGKYIALGGTMFLTATSVAWIFCELNASKFSKGIATIIFGLICPIVFIFLLGFGMWIAQGTFLRGISDPEGMKNIALIYFLFGALSSAIYWETTKNA